MAKLRKLGKAWYARVRITTNSGQSERCINLSTQSRPAAVRRLAEINRYEELIKTGEDMSFFWENEEKSTKPVELTLKEAFDEYLQYRTTDIDSPLRPTSYDIIQQSFTRVLKLIDGTTKLTALNQNNIDTLKAALVKAKFSIGTVNITMRNLRTWHGYYQGKGVFKADLIIKQISKKESRPIYIRNSDFQRILKVVNPYFQRLFTFYRGCGARLVEPFIAELDGSFLVIPASKSKNGKEREIFLTDDQIQTYLEMKEKTHVEHNSDFPNRKTYHFKYYSVAFQKACIKIGLKGRKFHSLRHTAAVRHYLTYRDIMATARMLGHSSIVTTEIYTKFDTYLT